MAVSTYPVPGFEFMPRTYSAAYLVAMEGETGSKKPTSRSGVFSDYNSLNGWATDIKKLGSQYTGMLAVDNYIDGLLMMIEFGTKDPQTVIIGACSLPYDNNHVALAAETGVNRILLTKAQAAGYVVGQTVSLDSNNYYSENVAKNRIITKIEDKSTDQTYIYFDGAAVNIPEGCHIGSRPWVNGAADVVAASSGSTVDNTSGKYPFIYRGKENPYANACAGCAKRTAAASPGAARTTERSTLRSGTSWTGRTQNIAQSSTSENSTHRLRLRPLCRNCGTLSSASGCCGCARRC